MGQTLRHIKQSAVARRQLDRKGLFERKRRLRAVLTNSDLLSGVTGVAGDLGSDVPGEKLFDLVDRVLGDA